MNHALASRMESGSADAIDTIDTMHGGLLESAADFVSGVKWLTPEDVVRITHESGCEFATAVLYQYFHNRLPDELKTSATSSCGADRRASLENTTLAIVPGALYRQRPDVGGDGRMLQEVACRNNWPVELIPTNGIGRVDENALIIRKWLAERPDRKILLVSLSKGSADTLSAVFHPDRSTPDNIAGWVNVSGIPFGTPIVNWMMKRWLFRQICRCACRIRGADIQAVRDLTFDETGRHWLTRSRPGFPVYHVAGFPCRKHLSCRRARLWYGRFSNNGPTDTVFMLSDLLGVPGNVIPLWGADHYLKSDWNPEQVFSSIIRHFAASQKEVDKA